MKNIIEQIAFYMIIALGLSILGFLFAVLPVQIMFGMAASISAAVVFLKMIVITGALSFIFTELQS